MNQVTRFIQQKIHHQVIPLVLLLCKLLLCYWISIASLNWLFYTERAVKGNVQKRGNKPCVHFYLFFFMCSFLNQYRHTSFYCASQILFLINWRSLATLCPVSLSAPFFTQHFLTLCLCHISAILTVFQTFTCYYICHVNLWSLIFNLLS